MFDNHRRNFKGNPCNIFFFRIKIIGVFARNIQLYYGSPLYWCRNPEREKHRLSGDKVYHIKLYQVHLAIHARLIGVYIATFNNISILLWISILLIEETREDRENHIPTASHRQT